MTGIIKSVLVLDLGKVGSMAAGASSYPLEWEYPGSFTDDRRVNMIGGQRGPADNEDLFLNVCHPEVDVSARVLELTPDGAVVWRRQWPNNASHRLGGLHGVEGFDAGGSDRMSIALALASSWFPSTPDCAFAPVECRSPHPMM